MCVQPHIGEPCEVRSANSVIAMLVEKNCTPEQKIERAARIANFKAQELQKISEKERKEASERTQAAMAAAAAPAAPVPAVPAAVPYVPLVVPRVRGVRTFHVEYATNNQSKCRLCRLYILRNCLRIKRVMVTGNQFWHPVCFVNNPHPLYEHGRLMGVHRVLVHDRPNIQPLL